MHPQWLAWLCPFIQPQPPFISTHLMIHKYKRYALTSYKNCPANA
jgi:hypothetical protein